jgi:hypothetical protein
MDASARRAATEALSRWERGAVPGFAGSLAQICVQTARAAFPLRRVSCPLTRPLSERRGG